MSQGPPRRDDGADQYGDEIVSVAGLEPMPVTAKGRDAVLETFQSGSRFHRFAKPVAEILDVSIAQAKRYLSHLDAEGTFVSGPGPFAALGFFWVEGGPKVEQAMTGFVRVPAFAHFPPHQHLGDETVFLLQGSLIEDREGRIIRAGESLSTEVDAEHAFAARPGPDLIYLAVADRGMQIVGGPPMLASHFSARERGKRSV